MIITEIERKRGVWTECNGGTLKYRSFKCALRIGISQENKLGSLDKFPMVLNLIVIQGDAADSVWLFRRVCKLGLLSPTRLPSNEIEKARKPAIEANRPDQDGSVEYRRSNVIKSP